MAVIFIIIPPSVSEILYGYNNIFNSGLYSLIYN